MKSKVRGVDWLRVTQRPRRDVESWTCFFCWVREIRKWGLHNIIGKQRSAGYLQGQRCEARWFYKYFTFEFLLLIYRATQVCPAGEIWEEMVSLPHLWWHLVCLQVGIFCLCYKLFISEKSSNLEESRLSSLLWIGYQYSFLLSSGLIKKMIHKKDLFFKKNNHILCLCNLQRR